MKRLVVTVLFLGSFLVASAPKQAAAQVNWQFGYQYLHLSDGEDGFSFPLGFAASGAYPVRGPWSVVGDLTWARHSEEFSGEDFSFKETTFGGGLRWTEPMKRRFGAQFLMGVNHEAISDCDDCSSNDFVIMPGVIASYPVNSSWNVFGRLEYRRIFFEGDAAGGVGFIVGLELPGSR